MVIWGFDCGLKGYAVAIEGKKILGSFRLPVKQRSANKMVKNKIDGPALRDLLKAFPAPDYVFIEGFNAMPQMSKPVIASLHNSIGVVDGVASSYCSNVVEILPEHWKAVFNLKGRDKTKRDSIGVANAIFPELQIKLVKDADKAEAALIAYYGQIYILGEL